MTRSQKIAFVGLALLALLFVYAVVMGHGKGGSSSDRPAPPAWLQHVGGVFDSPSSRIKLDPAEITLRNGNPVTVPVAGWSGKPELRTLRLTLTRGGRVHLESGDNKGDLPGDGDTPAARQRTSIPIRSGGGSVQLTCTVSPPCVLASD